MKFVLKQGLIEVVSLRAGKVRATPTDALALFEALCAERGVLWGRTLPAALCPEGSATPTEGSRAPCRQGSNGDDAPGRYSEREGYGSGWSVA